MTNGQIIGLRKIETSYFLWLTPPAGLEAALWSMLLHV